MLRSIIESGSIEEQLLVTSSVWKLSANNYKAKHSIRNSSIVSKLTALFIRLKALSSDDNPELNELLYVLEILNLMFTK